MNVPPINLLREAILRSIKALKQNDGDLFALPIEEKTNDDNPRKLHEVCINHKFAEHLAAEVRTLLDGMFVDIEFNREGINFKETMIEEKLVTVRPDIIVHNRKSEADKFNLLIVECKKSDAVDGDKLTDVKKIKALMNDPRYDYHFGLQVIYGSPSVAGTLFYKQDGSIKEAPITV
jgi:hypothetical protein